MDELLILPVLVKLAHRRKLLQKKQTPNVLNLSGISELIPVIVTHSQNSLGVFPLDVLLSLLH